MFWVLLWWWALFAIFFGVIWAFIDNFRRHDHSGLAKAGWALLILVLPLFGMLIYLIARPRRRRRSRLTTRWRDAAREEYGDARETECDWG